MDGLRTIGGATVGCFGLVAGACVVGLVVFLGFGWFACHTWGEAKRTMEAREQIDKRLAVSARGAKFTESGEAIECTVVWENLGEIAITSASGTLYLRDTGGNTAYSLDISMAQEIPPRKAVTVPARAKFYAFTDGKPDPATLKPSFSAKRLALADGFAFDAGL